MPPFFVYGASTARHFRSVNRQINRAPRSGSTSGALSVVWTTLRLGGGLISCKGKVKPYPLLFAEYADDIMFAGRVTNSTSLFIPPVLERGEVHCLR